FAGIGLGFLLGAPLNMLLSKTVDSSQYGASLGTLSLMRQMGMTLFPTIFAGFVTASVHKLEDGVKAVGTNEVSIPSGDEDAMYGLLMNEIDLIGDVSVQSELYHVVAFIMGEGFNQMFLTAMV